MEIIPLGHASFKLKGKGAAIITDPFNPDMVGLKFPKHTTADAITVSHAHEDHNFTSIVEKETDVVVAFTGPGEYEIKGVDILGVPTYHDNKDGKERGKNTVYKIEIDGISVVHLGDLGHKLTEEQEELLDGVHVLLIPVGGKYTIDAKLAAEVATSLEPAIIIPMHYLRPGLKAETFAGLLGVSPFLKEMGKENVTALPKIKVTKDALPQEMQVVVLE